MDKKIKVLVVDDNDFVRMQIVHFLTEEGFDTLQSTDGQDALNMVSSDVDIVVADVRMEPVDGFEFIRIIRSSNIMTPVILVTGDDNPDLLNESSKLGVGAVLKKPVQKERLIKTISRTLGLEKRT